MALLTDHSLFLHVPKTGGTWIRHAYERGINFTRLGSQHSKFPDLLKCEGCPNPNTRFIYAFVRHPITWYQSRWAFRLKTGWITDHPLDKMCASNNFTTFIENVVTHYPNGWLTFEYSQFIDTVPKPIDFVGRMEFLNTDFIKALQLANEPHIPRFDSASRINNADLDGKTSFELAQYPPSLLKSLLDVERAVIDKYYPDIETDWIIKNQYERK
jgi:hypothetical protein